MYACMEKMVPGLSEEKIGTLCHEVLRYITKSSLLQMLLERMNINKGLWLYSYDPHPSPSGKDPGLLNSEQDLVTGDDIKEFFGDIHLALTVKLEIDLF